MLPSANVAVNAPPILTEWLFNQGASPPSDECTLPDKIIVDGTLGGNISKYNAVESVNVMASDTDDSSSSFFVNSRTLMGSRGFRYECPKYRHQCPLDSVASYLIHADVRTFR